MYYSQSTTQKQTPKQNNLFCPPSSIGGDPIPSLQTSPSEPHPNLIWDITYSPPHHNTQSVPNLIWDITYSPPHHKTQSTQRIDRTWKSNQGWVYLANKERSLLLLNSELMGKPYTYELTISLLEPLTETQIKKLWRNISQSMSRRNIVCYWRLEITKANLIHWHITIANSPDMPKLKQALKHIIPIRNTIEYQPIDPNRQAGWIGYMLKAKTKVGKRKDISYYDRVMFKEGVRLRRSGTIGKFWTRPKSELDQMRKDRNQLYNEKQNALYLSQHPNLAKQVDRITRATQNQGQTPDTLALVNSLRRAKATDIYAHLDAIDQSIKQGWKQNKRDKADRETQPDKTDRQDRQTTPDQQHSLQIRAGVYDNPTITGNNRKV